MTSENIYPPEAPKECDLCPRLRRYILEKRAEQPDWYNGAVPSFGDPNAKLLIIGLAPGVTGANRTGRPFTGDWAGDLLYETLERFGLTTGTYQKHAEDGLQLHSAMITNAVRCVPPQNKPIGSEINQCRPFLASRISELPHLRVLLCLGKISHDSTVRALGARLKDHPFGHASEYSIGNYVLLSSYHCSRYNTNTRRLTPEMFSAVFERARSLIEA